VDVYSRYAFVKLLKTKSARNVANKFEQIILEENETPLKIQSDEGTEFALIKRDLAKKYNFTLFHTYNRETKAVHAERFIETLKLMILRSLTTLNQGYNYVKNLDLIVERYNESPHRSLHNLTPFDVYKNGKTLDGFRIMKATLNNTKPTLRLLKKGDSVRIARLKNNIFEKSSLRRWVKEKFLVKKVFITDPVTYELEHEKVKKLKVFFIVKSYKRYKERRKQKNKIIIYLTIVVSNAKNKVGRENFTNQFTMPLPTTLDAENKDLYIRALSVSYPQTIENVKKEECGILVRLNFHRGVTDVKITYEMDMMYITPRYYTLEKLINTLNIMWKNTIYDLQF
jgi:hypothetical protein